MAIVQIERAGPLTTIQDAGRFGALVHGVTASGPMDSGAYGRAGLRAGASAEGAIEFTMAGLALRVREGRVAVGWDGGAFTVRRNEELLTWPGRTTLSAGEILDISPGSAGNYGYLRFGGRIDLPGVMGSLSTSTRARLGGVGGRALQSGDVLHIAGQGGIPVDPGPVGVDAGPIRFLWGLHADLFSAAQRDHFTSAAFRTTVMMDRMGVRLKDEAGVFAGAQILSLVSDPIVAGDIQILGDGTPIVLMRDHQPTGGYPRIGTVITADLDRFAQIRPNRTVEFMPVSLDHAHRLLRSRKS